MSSLNPCAPGHRRFVAYLAKQYAYSLSYAEDEAARRYILYPGEVSRWKCECCNTCPDCGSTRSERLRRTYINADGCQCLSVA